MFVSLVLFIFVPSLICAVREQRVMTTQEAKMLDIAEYLSSVNIRPARITRRTNIICCPLEIVYAFFQAFFIPAAMPDGRHRRNNQPAPKQPLLQYRLRPPW